MNAGRERRAGCAARLGSGRFSVVREKKDHSRTATERGSRLAATAEGYIMQSLNREVCLSRETQQAGRRFVCFVAVLALYVVTAGSTASAATITVNSGQSIATGIASAASGDTVVVNAGTYTGSINGKTGVTVRANGVVTVNGGVNLTCNSCSVVGFKFVKGSVWMQGNDILLEGNDFNGKGSGEDYGNMFGSRITVRRNFFHGVRIPDDLALVEGGWEHNDVLQFWNNNGETLHDAVIEQNIFTDFVQGVFLANETGNTSSMSNLTIRNNVFWGTDFIESQNLIGSPSHGAFVGKANITGVSITNNLFYNVANCVSLYAMSTAIVQGNVILNGGTAYAVGDGTQADAFNRGTVGNVLWSNGWNGYPAQGPDKYVNPLLINVNSLLGADGVPWTADDGWRTQSASVTGYGPQIAAGGTPVADVLAPVITLNGVTPMSVVQGSVYTEPGATALDARDGEVIVTISGTVNTAVLGTYTRTYTARDAAGNTATKTRTVSVVTSTQVNTAPTISLSGPTSPIQLADGQTAAAFTVTANGSDAQTPAGSLAYLWAGGTNVNVISTNQLPGTTTYSCTVTDAGGLTAAASITVTVLAASATSPAVVKQWVRVRIYDASNVLLGYAWVSGTTQTAQPTTAP